MGHIPIPTPIEDVPGAGELSGSLNRLIAEQIAKLRAEIEDQMRRLAGPLVARLGGTVSLSAEDLAKSWSLSVLELPDGGVTLTAVELTEGMVERRCRVCGCTDDRACPGGCSWVQADLCSRCTA